MAFTENNENGIIYMTSEVIPARHAFTTRYGGVSKGGFASLDLSTNRGDDPTAVEENFRRVCALMGVDMCSLVRTRQVHGNEVRIVTERDKLHCTQPVPYDADGLVTNVKGLAIVCFVADCVPVLLVDPVNSVVAAVHCGWRSSVADILGVTVAKMRSLGAETGSIRAAMGAAIGRCCFETHSDVPEAIEKYLSGDTEALFDPKDGGKFMVDLRAANARRLVQLGVKEENIDISKECTVCSHEKYWSHRYTKGDRGSQAAVIVLD